MQFGCEQLSSKDVRGKRVIEVGSMNINGSLRDLVKTLEPATYVGVDFLAGAGVDIVCNAEDLASLFGRESFDVVISTEMLEHAENWQGAVTAMKEVLISSGILLLTARGPGMFLHGYPFDWHRFTVEDMRRIFADFEIETLLADPQAPGVLLLARKPRSWRPCNLSSIHVAPADEVNAPR
jgi:hypothetical protein